MGIKSLLNASCVGLLVMFSNVYAATLSYGGYTHDTNTDIVAGNGLEWLQWDRTVGESISSIQSQLNTIEGGGWTIASNVQMAHLFNAFQFGLTFDDDENTRQDISTGFTSGDLDTEVDKIFISMFGDTIAAGNFCYQGDCAEEASAWYGLDLDSDNLINQALVADDSFSQNGRMLLGVVAMFQDNNLDTESDPFIGVALVRTPAVVPIPAAVWLFGSGLLGLISIARRKA